MQECSIYINVSTFRGMGMIMIVFVSMIMSLMIVAFFLVFMWSVIMIVVKLTL